MMSIIQSPSKHHSSRRNEKIKACYLHHTAGTDSLEYLRNNMKQVSAHYLVQKSGAVHQLVDESEASHHAGFDKLGSAPNVNWVSIGIEVENKGDGIDPYPEEQLEAVADLCKEIKLRYPEIVFIPHRLTSTTGKIDPSFDWDDMMSRIYSNQLTNRELKLEEELETVFSGLYELIRKYGTS